MPDPNPILVGRRLHCGYAAGEPVVVDADVTIARGEVVAILGGSGSGKTTLLKTLGGLLPPLSGEVELFGEPLYAVDPERRAALLRRTGTLFQRDALFGSMTVLDNVALPARQLTDMPEELVVSLAERKLTMVEIGQLARRMPADISGGQRKRAAMARAIMLDPELLLCDEPTSGLDPIMAARIDRLLLKLRDAFGISIVAVTHDVESVKVIADWAMVLGNGRVKASGTVADLEHSSDPEVFAFFHRVQGTALREHQPEVS